MLGLNGDFATGSSLRHAKSGLFVIYITGSGRPGGRAGGATVGKDPCCAPVNQPACGRLAFLECLPSSPPAGCNSRAERRRVCRPSQHPRKPVQSGSSGLDAIAGAPRLLVRRCSGVACDLGPGSENKLGALGWWIANRSFTERGDRHVNWCARLPAPGWCARTVLTLHRCSGVGYLFVR